MIPEKPKQSPVAIVGMACIFAKSPDLNAYLHLLSRGINGISDPPASHEHLCRYFDPDPKKADHIYCNRGGFIPHSDFDPTEFGIPPSALEATDTSQLLGLLTAKKALEDAGYGISGKIFDRSRTSVILGVTGTQELVIPLGSRLGHPLWRKALLEAGIPEDTVETIVDKISNSYVDWQENSFPGLLGNVVAGRIANRLDLGGTNCVVDAACASSMGAIHVALLELEAGRSDMVITGGVDTLNDIFMHMCFAKTHILSTSGDVRPFSKDADGTVLGEGVGLVVLKRLEDAQKDNDRIYAVIRGIGSASDGKSQSIYAPRPAGQASALMRAYQNANIDPSRVALLEAHGTGTRVGDGVEFQALRQVFENSDATPHQCALGSVKSNIGHTKAAAGTAGLIKAALSLYHKILPPTLKVGDVDPKLEVEHSPFYINQTLRPWLASHNEKRIAGVSAFGFGGSNFHVVLEESSSIKEHPSWDGSVDIVAFSADGPNRLAEQLDQWHESAKSCHHTNEFKALSASSRHDFNPADPMRLLMVLPGAPGNDQIDAYHHGARDLMFDPTHPRSELTNHIFLGDGPQAGPLAFLFPGQGSQYVGMGRHIISSFPESLMTFEKAVGHMNTTPDLDECIFPKMPGELATHQQRLRRTDIAQPAIGAVSVAMLAALQYFGIAPEATCGHSYGELTALHAAGWLSQEDLWALSIARGNLMSEAANNKTSSGTMMAVAAPTRELEKVAEKIDGLVLANYNGPEQGVLSGTTSAIDRARIVCQERGWKCLQLAVSGGFHSPLMADAKTPFENLLAKISFQPGRISVMSNALGDAYPDDPVQIRRALGRQLVQPVRFLSNIEKLYHQGIRGFVEVGPKSVLTGLVRSILAGRRYCAFSMDRSHGRADGLMDLADFLCALGAFGYPVRLDRWENTLPNCGHKPRMRISLNGANYRTTKTTLPSEPPSQAPASPLKMSPSSSAEAGIQVLAQHKVPSNGLDSVSIPPVENGATFSSPQLSTTQSKNTMTHQHTDFLKQSLAAMQQGIASMQALQSQTTQAHQKFLEVQAEANKSLAAMIQSAQHLSAGGLRQPFSKTPFNLNSHEADPAPKVSSFDNRLESDSHHPRPINPATEPKAAPVHLTQTTTTIPAAPESDLQNNTVQVEVVAIVSELTGYPVEMLTIEMDIESDLGIDSIKRVEILSAVEEKMPHLPKVTPDMLGDLKTLGQICAYLTSRNTDRTIESNASPVNGQIITPPPFKDDPAPTLKRCIVTPEVIGTTLGNASDNFDIRVQTLIVSGNNALGQAIGQEIKARGGSYRLATPDETPCLEDTLAGLVLISPLTPLQAFTWARACGPLLLEAAEIGPAFFCSMSFLDGAFGFMGGEIQYPDQGALSGLIKTAALEWPAVHCRALDVDPQWQDLSQIARSVVAQLHPGCADPFVEIGLTQSHRYRLSLEQTSPSSIGALNLSEQDVVVVTGGARGITALAAKALAQKTKCRLALLGRSDTPHNEPLWLAGLTAPSAIKKAILSHGLDNKDQTPMALEKAYQYWMANRQISNTMQDFAESGISANYFSVDVRQPSSLMPVFAHIRKELGPVRALIHGAGILKDRLIVDKTAAQFESVYDTKANGLNALLEVSCEDDLRYVVLFSSVSGRFGNTGQSDYAMANEVLNKTALQQAQQRPKCKIISMNWGPWDGGMVDPALKRHFQQRGVALIQPHQGVNAMLEEMATPLDHPVEMIVEGLPALQAEKVPAPSDNTRQRQSSLNIPLSLAARRQIDLSQYPVLESHYLNGRPVVPLALITEWLAHGALHANPGLVLHGIDHLRLFKGIALEKPQKKISLMTGSPKRKGDVYEVSVEIHDDDDNARPFIHTSATAILMDQIPSPPLFKENGHFKASPPVRTLDDYYRDVLFHGHALQGLKEIIRISDKGMTASIEAAPAPSKWINDPWRSQWIIDPLVLDCAFQMAIIWCHEQMGLVSLPNYLTSYRQYCDRFPAQGVSAVLEVEETSKHKMMGRFTFLDRKNTVVATMEGFEAIIDRSLFKAFGVKAA